jgi:adenylate kinase
MGGLLTRPHEHPSMRIVLLGAPGSGKGTQGRVLAERLGVPYIGSGDLLRARAAAAEPGSELAAVLDRGDLVGDDDALAAVRDALAAAEAAGGYVLDGFPRTAGQARDLEAVASPDAVVYLALPDAVARRRLAGRAAAGRSDDVAATVERRLDQFHRQIEPLLDFYGRRGVLITVDADQAPDAVTAAIVEALDAAGRRPS